MTTVGHLFAGIDGFGLGLATVGGFEHRFTVELDDFSHSILKLRLGDGVEHHRDVRTFHPPPVDILTGGFPCQDLSAAGKGTGITGERSGLWTEYARIIGEARPQAALIENVPMLLRRGMEVVVHDLVELGYSLEWDCLPAAAFGAPHLRDRVWIVAHRQPEPRIFGDAVQLFPAPWADLPLTEDGWHSWPRAGFVSGTDLIELEPLAPKSRVVAGELLPTPVANDVRGGVVHHLRNKLGWDEGDRTRITSLAVLARNGFRQPSPEQLAEARALAAESGRANADKFADGETPADDPAQPFSRLLPTPTAGDGDHGSEQSFRYYAGLGDNPTLLGAARTLDGAAQHPSEGLTAPGAAPPMFPTPRALDATGVRGKTPNRTPEANARAGASLTDVALGTDHLGRPGLWPTPNAADGLGGRNERSAVENSPEGSRSPTRPSGAKAAISLRTAVLTPALWPTPQTMDARRPGRPPEEVDAIREETGAGCANLRDAVLDPVRWPTPRASGGESISGGGEGGTYRRTPSQLAGTHGRYLQTEAIETDLEQGLIDEDDVDRYRGDGGALNPVWVEWLMGFPLGWTDPTVSNDELEVHPWTSEPPGVPRTLTGVPLRRERLTALGNALVPIAAAWLGERLCNVITVGENDLAA